MEPEDAVLMSMKVTIYDRSCEKGNFKRLDVEKNSNRFIKNMLTKYHLRIRVCPL